MSDAVKIQRIDDTNHAGWPVGRSVDLKVDETLHTRSWPYVVDVERRIVEDVADIPQEQFAIVTELATRCCDEPALAKMIERMEVYGRVIRVGFRLGSDTDYALDLLLPIVIRILRIIEAVRLSQVLQKQSSEEIPGFSRMI